VAEDHQGMSAFWYTVAGTLVGIVLGIVVGGAITALVSRYFYERAGDELRQVAAELDDTFDTMLRILEQYRVIDEVRRDEQDKPIKPQIIRIKVPPLDESDVYPPVEDESAAPDGIGSWGRERRPWWRRVFGG
jgi:hypothetical protein